MALMRLSEYDHDNDKWNAILFGEPEVTEMGRIDTIEVFGLTPHAIYKLEVFKDAFSEHAHIEEVEMGERYGQEFSIKIDFSEFDDEKMAQNLQRQFKDFLPVSID